MRFLSRKSVRRSGSAFALAFALCAFGGRAAAQPADPQGLTTGALERFQPSVPGDALLGVPSPSVGFLGTPEGEASTLLLRGGVIVDYAFRPLSIQDGDTRADVVSDQLFLHAALSLSLFHRIQLSLDMPFLLAQGGATPTVGGVTFPSAAAAGVGDLRIGARATLFGGYWDPFQVGIGGVVYVPTGPSGGYVGEGAVRGEPQIILGGRTEHFVYSASLGTTIRGSVRPHSFDARVGAALVLGESRFQVGPELYVSAPFSEDVVLDTPTTKIAVASPVSAELLLGAKLRVFDVIVLGAGVGPGLTQGWGTPVLMGVGSVMYEPKPPPREPRDTDGDKIFDPQDACPTVPGVPSEDPTKHGCPKDTDGDKIVDPEDACPAVPGAPDPDPKKNGCPKDTDGDKIIDPEDACPTVPGVPDPDPKKNGCPKDTDGDKIIDPQDACPTVPGVPDPDPTKNGCPKDTDGDKIIDPEDACPTVPGVPDPDPKKNGCPLVKVTPTEIVISRQVQFKFGKSRIDQTVDPVSDDLLNEVRNAIVEHPEIELIEVQGHADTVGAEAFNQELSEARAKAVRDWLVQRGIAQEKLTTKGYGSSVPISSNDTEEGRRENRRVQFKIVKRKDPASK